MKTEGRRVALTELDRGEKVDMHITLYEREADILDHLVAAANSSRAAVIGALLIDYDEQNPIEKLSIPTAPGPRSRRR